MNTGTHPELILNVTIPDIRDINALEGLLERVQTRGLASTVTVKVERSQHGIRATREVGELAFTGV